MDGGPVRVLREVFVDADGVPVESVADAAAIEVEWLDDDGTEQRTYLIRR